MPALSEIRSTLETAAKSVTPEAMQRLGTFLTDGTRSPLYSDSPEGARRGAQEIAVAFMFNATAGDRANPLPPAGASEAMAAPIVPRERPEPGRAPSLQ
jgi:hypothetical protein